LGPLPFVCEGGVHCFCTCLPTRPFLPGTQFLATITSADNVSSIFLVHGQRGVYTGNVRLPMHVFARKSVLHLLARRLAFWPKSLSRTMFSPSFHVHGQRRVYTGNVWLPMHVFARKTILHVLARRLVFCPKSLSRAMFLPSFHVHGQRRVYTGNVGLPMHVFGRKSVLHVVAQRLVFWPKSLSRTMFSPSFHVHGQRWVTDARCCPKVRFTRCCPALSFLAKITVAYHVLAQFSCTRASSGYRCTCFPEIPF